MADVLYHGVPLDLYTVSKYMLGYDRMNDHHKEWCKTLAVVRKKHNRVLLLKPRATFKSTFYTVSSTIDYLIDDWVKHNGVFHNRTLIASATDEMAKQLLGEIVQHLRGNENVKSFFGYDPIKSSTQQELWLTPKKVHKEPTIKAKGALSSIVSEHYDRIIVDDLCFDEQTEILTNNGWKFFKNLNKDDLVATLNGEELEYHNPTRYISYEYNGEMIGIKGDAINFLVTPDHNLYFKKARDDKFSLQKASDIYGYVGEFKKNAIWKGEEIERFKLNGETYGNNYSSKLLDLPMDDFLWFLGLYIAEGNINSRNGIRYNTVYISQSKKKNPEKYNKIKNRIGVLFEFCEHIDKNEVVQFIINSSQLASYLECCGIGSLNKKVPLFVKGLSPRQIEIFLDGFFFGDGNYVDNHRVFNTSSKQLADDIQELLFKIGSAPNIGYYEGKTCNPQGKEYISHCYRIGDSKTKITPYIRKNHWFKTDYHGHVYCVDVPNHIIYVRRNGKGVWLGNCNNEDRESQAVREQKIRWFIDLISILEPDGELLVVGTRWHDADVYNYIMEMNEKLPERDKYHIEIEAICDENGNPNFNEIYSKDDIERLKIEKGLIEFYAQYMNQTLPSETQRFKPEHFRFYPDNGIDDRQFAGAAKFMYVDPALGRENDYSVALVGFVKPSNPEWLYVRNAFISNVTTPDQTIDEIARLVEMYDIPVVDVEANNFQTMFANAIRNRKVFVGTKKERKIAVREVRNRKKKELRIDSIEPFFTQHKVYFCEDWKQYYPELIDQLVRYPVHQHDDCPDAMEGLIRISLKGAASMREMIGMVGGKMRRTFMKNNRSRWR